MKFRSSLNYSASAQYVIILFKQKMDSIEVTIYCGIQCRQMHMPLHFTMADIQDNVKQVFADYQSGVEAMVLQIEDTKWGWLDFDEYYYERFRKAVRGSKESPARLSFRLIAKATLTYNASYSLDGISNLCEDRLPTGKNDGQWCLAQASLSLSVRGSQMKE